MDETTKNLIAALEQVAQKTSPNTQSRQIAVRWLNRLYYELARWNKEFIDFLDTYPGTRIDAVQEDYESFQGDFSDLLEILDEDNHWNRHSQYLYGVENKFPQNEVCTRLEFLAQRIPIDFSWMRNQDPEAYEEFLELVGSASSSRFMFVNLTGHLYRVIFGFEKKISPWNSEAQPSKEKIMELFEEYKKQSVKHLDLIKTSAWQVGIKLLSITEYDEALQKEGSINPNLLVIGEVAMSQDTYNNIGQAGAVGRNARSDNNNFYQSQQTKNLAESAEEIQNLLKQLEQTNPNATEDEKVSYVNDETTPSFKRRVVSALQAGGEAAIEKFLDNPYLNVGKAVVKGWIKPE